MPGRYLQSRQRRRGDAAGSRDRGALGRHRRRLRRVGTASCGRWRSGRSPVASPAQIRRGAESVLRQLPQRTLADRRSVARIDRSRPHSQQAEVWEKVAAKLRTGAMPPARMPRPDDSTLNGVVTSIESTLDEAAARQPNPGRPAIHRMNRVEYSNAVRDLLALDIAGDAMLPADTQGFGFDNNADLLTMSPVLMDRYMLAARKIARLAIGDPGMRPIVETYTVSRLLTQRDRMSEELPFGSRGGLAVRHHFPLDAEYIVRIRLQGGGSARAGDQLELRLDGEAVKRFAFEAPPSVGARQCRRAAARSDLRDEGRGEGRPPRDWSRARQEDGGARGARPGAAAGWQHQLQGQRGQPDRDRRSL